MKNNDFSKSLKALFEADVPAPVAPAPAGPTTSKVVEVMIRELRKAISTNMNLFERKLVELDQAMGRKMQEFAATAGSDSDTIEKLQRTVKDLQSNYENKKNEVDAVLKKVDSILPELASLPEASAKLGKIQQTLNAMAQELESKSQEVARLTAEMDDNKMSAHQALLDNQKTIYELDDYANHVSSQLEKAQKEIGRLEELVSRHQRVKAPKSAFEAVEPENINSDKFGKFDLYEYLQKAKDKQQKFNESKTDKNKKSYWDGVL